VVRLKSCSVGPLGSSVSWNQRHLHSSKPSGTKHDWLVVLVLESRLLLASGSNDPKATSTGTVTRVTRLTTAGRYY
jgi:hypothetical protein